MARTWTAVYAAMTTSARCAALPDDTCRFFYTQLLLVADGHGSIDSRPHILNAKVWPLLQKPTSEVVRVVEELEAAGLIQGYSDESKSWITVPDWEDKAGTQLRHSSKSDRRADPEFPSCTEYRAPVRGHPGYSGNVPEHPPDRERERPKRDSRESVYPPTPRKRGESFVPVWPTALDTPEVRAAWDEWNAYRVERGSKPYRQTGFTRLMGKAKGKSAAEFVRAIQDSIASNWQGIHFRQNGAVTNVRPTPSYPKFNG